MFTCSSIPYATGMSESVAVQLKRWREHSGLSVRKAAEAAGMKPSSYQHYEDPDRFKGSRLPMELTQALARAATTMQLDPSPVLALGGIDEDGTLKGMQALSDVEMMPYRIDNASVDRRDAALAAILEGTNNWSPWLIRGRA